MQLTKRHYIIIGGGLLVVALTLSAAKLRHRYDAVTPPEPTAAEQVTPPQPTAMPVTLPEHTAIRVTLDQSLATNRSRAGDHFAHIFRPGSNRPMSEIPTATGKEGEAILIKRAKAIVDREVEKDERAKKEKAKKDKKD